MAEDLDDGEFWLPSQFLSDDDMLLEKKDKINSSKGANGESAARGVCFRFEFPLGYESYGANSALSSPVESVVGSNEAESEEDDFMAGLTRKMAHSMLQDDVERVVPAFGADNPKEAWVLAGSPQSTLCGAGSWFGCSAGSGHGSPNGPSQVSSPPSTPMNEDDAWDLLYAVAGRMRRMNAEMPKFHQGRGLLGPPRKLIPITAPLKNVNGGFQTNQALNHQQLQSNQFQQLRQQQLMKQQCSAVWGRQANLAGTGQQNQQQVAKRARTGGFVNGRSGPLLGLSSAAWPSLPRQQQAGSGIPTVSLGGSVPRRESCGTGVFLPRRITNPADSRKKTACSPALLPGRVVQARAQAAMNREIRLPQEWTY